MAVDQKIPAAQRIPSTLTALWSRLDTYLPRQYFFAMVALAAVLHVFGLVVWSVMPASPVIEVPVRVLNIKFSGDEIVAMPALTETEALSDAKPSKSDAVSELLATDKTPVPVPQYVRETTQKPSKKKKGETTQTPIGNSKEADAEVMARYEQLISIWIEKHRIYPQEAREMRLEGDAVIRIRIDRNGLIQQISLYRSAGDPLLDRAALQMAQKANPVPAVPDNYPAGNVLEFLVPVSFKLQ